MRHERRLLRERGGLHLACVDEVGRGALAGPVTLGVVVIALHTRTAPQGVRDSKLLTPAARASLAPRIRRWAVAHAVASASAAEIDSLGIMAALRLAGRRALRALPVVPDLVLLDGNHDYLTPSVREDSSSQSALPMEITHAEAPIEAPSEVLPPVTTMIKGDLKCAGVAAASVLAKLDRDAQMVELARLCPQYRWDENKGYAAVRHTEALREHGPSVHHRRSWNLPGATDVGAGLSEGAPGLFDSTRLEFGQQGRDVS